MERRYDLYLEDMIEAIESIQEYTEGMSFEEFEESSMEKDAVLRNFQKLGEAVGELPDSFKEENDQVVWQDVKDFRNVIVHQYWKVDEEIAWDIIQNRLPELRNQLARLVEE